MMKKFFLNYKKIGYFYFRLGDDPGDESQKIQGYDIEQECADPELKGVRQKGENKRELSHFIDTATLEFPVPSVSGVVDEYKFLGGRLRM